MKTTKLGNKSTCESWKICLVLPTKNEEPILRDVVEELREAFRSANLREPVIIIADDSHDNTRQLAHEMGVHVAVGGGKGLGYAMLQGLKVALRFQCDVIISMDADGQSDPAEIKDFLGPLERGEVDMVLGSRFLEPGLIEYRYRWRNRFGIVVLSWILRRFTGLPLTDSHGGIRAFKADVVRELDIIGTHTYVQETIIDAYEKGFRIKEIASIWRKRKHGRSQVVGSIPKYIMYTLPVLLIRSGVHVKWLYSVGSALVALAFSYFLVVCWQESFQFKAMFSRLPSFVMIALLVIVGLQLFTVGFLAELIKNVKSRVDRLDFMSGDRNHPSQTVQEYNNSNETITQVD